MQQLSLVDTTCLEFGEVDNVQFVLLATLTYATGKNGFNQKQLAEYAQIDVMMTSQVVKKLKHK